MRKVCAGAFIRTSLTKRSGHNDDAKAVWHRLQTTMCIVPKNVIKELNIDQRNIFISSWQSIFGYIGWWVMYIYGSWWVANVSSNNPWAPRWWWSKKWERATALEVRVHETLFFSLQNYLHYFVKRFSLSCTIYLQLYLFAFLPKIRIAIHRVSPYLSLRIWIFGLKSVTHALPSHQFSFFRITHHRNLSQYTWLQLQQRHLFLALFRIYGTLVCAHMDIISKP